MEVEMKDGGGELSKFQALKSLVHHAGHGEPLNEFNMRKTYLVLNTRINSLENITC